MTAPVTQEPTRKAFHFPTSPTGQETDPAEAAAAPEQLAQTASVARKAPKATRPASEKAASAAKKAVKAKRSATSETAPAVKKATRPKRPATSKAAPASVAEAKKAKPPKKEKVVRDSFTMPKSDYDRIASLKQKCLEAGVSVKKSELLRAGLMMLESATPQRLLAAVSLLETVKTGRPAKD